MAPTISNIRSMNSESGSGCSYTDGSQYVGCQVAAKGWPTPQYMSGGKRKRKMSKKRKLSRKTNLKRRRSNKSYKKRRPSRKYRR